MKVGDYIETPRFLRVCIVEIFESIGEAWKAGYTEPTHFRGDLEVFGKVIGENRMIFAAVKR